MKKLPVVNSPSIGCDLPLLKKKIFFRPFVVREQKALLLAQQSNDEPTIYATIKDVINSCTNGEIDLDQLPVPDLSWLFLQMKIASSGAEQKMGIKCAHCEETIQMLFNLNGAKVENTLKSMQVMLTDSVGIVFRWPTITDYMNAYKAKDSTIAYIFMIVDKIFDETQVYEKKDFTEEEFQDWIENLNDEQILKIKEFIDAIPDIQQEINFKCPHCQKENRKLLEGLHDFFRLDDDQ